jgi:hypothetical protein
MTNSVTSNDNVTKSHLVMTVHAVVMKKFVAGNLSSSFLLYRVSPPACF